MTEIPPLSVDDLRHALQADIDRTLAGIADAVNSAPDGRLIAASEEKVRDLLARFRTTAFQTAIQLRLDAAQAAFPPSGRS